ncbi:exodeoxyribonuclease III [Candidatus Parcubacteria bacterium]|nr:exodeoxyribonuclease III [Candidatus Parcubacteria bacterium]
MQIISWNVNGLRAVDRKGSFARILEEEPDILCIQETKSLPEQLTEEVRNPKYGKGQSYHSYFHFPTVKKGYSGVGIYSKVKPEKVVNDLNIPEMDQEGRLIMADYGHFILINCYFPNGGGAPERLEYKLAFYDHFLAFIEKLRKKNPNIIFCGDVNVAHNEIDLARPKENAAHVGFLPIERAWMDKLISKGWVDVFRHTYPEKREAYTYWDMKSFARERNVGWRIDYFFTTPEMLEKVEKIEILDEILGSDHCPVRLTLAD